MPKSTKLPLSPCRLRICGYSLIRDQEDDIKDQQILDLWLQCMTQEEIGGKIGTSRQNVQKILDKATNGIIAESGKTPPESLQIENLWVFPRCDDRYGTKDYPGPMNRIRLQDIYFTLSLFFAN